MIKEQSYIRDKLKDGVKTIFLNVHFSLIIPIVRVLENVYYAIIIEKSIVC